MPGQGVGLVALVLLGPLIQSAGSWTLLERFFFQPQALPSCNDSGNASSCSNNTPDNATQGSHSKGTSEDRGSTSSPDPTEDAEWLWWFLKVGWISMWRLADTSLVWCGTLCASVGVAAKWSYWLMVSIVGIFLMQLCLWSVTWVICPFLRHLQALYRYLRGYGGWHEVAHLHGFRVFRPRWTGPKGAEEWSSDFVQQSVRGRGDSRDPFDLLVTDGVAIARLRHGTLRGRTNRHGYRCNGGTVYASSHRYFRNQLEALGLEIHLCAGDPCTLHEDDCFHIQASATIPRDTELDLHEAAGRGPIGRCVVATWFWGCRCAPFSALAKMAKMVFSCFCKSACCTRRRKRVAQNGEGPQTPRHADSETESEGDDDSMCQADHIGYMVNGSRAPLSLHTCRDVASQGLVRLLPSDAQKSNQEELKEEGGAIYFAACHHHKALYENSASRRRCVVEDCPEEAKTNRDGLRLCRLHAVKEEKLKGTPKAKKPEDPKAKPKRVVTNPRPVPEETEPIQTPGPDEARSAPVEPEGTAKDEVSGEGKGLLATYLRAILQGVEPREALCLTSGPQCGFEETYKVLREAALEVLPKLPADYPTVAKKAILDLIMEVHHNEEQPTQIDPVLSLKTPERVQNPPRSSEVRATQEPESTYARSYEVETPVTREQTGDCGWQAFYRPKGSHHLPTTAGAEVAGRSKGGAVPQAQDALAMAARPRHMGAFTDAEPRQLDETAKALQTIARTLSGKDEATGHDRGKLAAIGKVEERIVYLLRGCDSLTVLIATATVGKELYHALKGTATQGRPQLRSIQFPVNINNRIAFGMASLSFGGKDTRALPDYCLSAADFPLTSEEDFDRFTGTVDNKLEKRPKPPVSLSQWYRNALRESWAVCCVMGTEHYSALEGAATYLLKLGEEHAYMWPPSELYNVWEELWARFVEELRELDRQLRRAMKEDAPTFERIRFFATAPGPDGEPWLRLPRTFYLEDPEEYFQSDVVPRHNRMLSRACWQVAHKRGIGGLQGRRAGESEEQGGANSQGTAADSRPDPNIGKADKTPKPKDPPKLLGNSLTGKEGARSLDHRPKDKKTGKYVCWDHITHRGCSAPNCPHAHLKQPPKWDTLDWSVQLQLLRRGGLRDRGQLNAKDVVAQMDTIRVNVKSKNEENVREGKRAKSGGPVNPPEEAEEGAPQEDRDKVGESPPEELLEFHPTDLENRLVEWLEGGDPSFTEDADESRHVRDFPAEGLPAVAEERIKAMAEIDKTELANGI